MKIKLLWLGIVVGTFALACTRDVSPPTPPPEDDTASTPIDERLKFDNVTLEQLGQDGQLLWKVQAKEASYSKDRRVAQVVRPVGNLYRDGKIAYKIQADRGEIFQDGEKILLRGNIVANVPQEKAIWQGSELEWQPGKDLMLVRGGSVGSHPKADMWAQEIRLNGRKREVELLGQVVMNARDPDLQLRAEKLLWQLQKQLVISDLPVQIDRFEEEKKSGAIAKDDKAKDGAIAEITKMALAVKDRAKDKNVRENKAENVAERRVLRERPPGILRERTIAEKARVDLAKQITFLESNARIQSSEPSLEVIGDRFVWNLQQRTLQADAPLTLANTAEGLIIVADRGNLDLKKQQALLFGSATAPLTVLQEGEGLALNADRGSIDLARNSILLFSADDRPLRVVQEREGIVLTADRASIDLAQNLAVLTGNSGAGKPFTLLQINEGINVTADRASMNLRQNTAALFSAAGRPVTVVQESQGLTITADRGDIDLARNTAVMTGDIPNGSPITIVQANEGITATADRGDMNLARNTAVLTGNAAAGRPLTIVQAQEGITATADRGSIDLAQNAAVLTGNVFTVQPSSGAQIEAGELVWNLRDRSFFAKENVRIQQSDPPLTMSGPVATGTLRDRAIVVTSTPEGRAVSEFVP